MTTRYHKKRKPYTRHVNIYKCNGHIKANKRNQAGRVCSPAGDFATPDKEAYGDLIKAQVLKEKENTIHFDYDDYLENAYREWELWTSQIAERIYRIKTDYHEYLSLFEKDD